MTVPRFLMALIIVYLLVFQFNVSEIGSFYLAPIRRRAMVLRQVC